MSSNDHPLQKRRRVSRCEYSACDRGPNGTSVNNRKFSGFVGLFQRMFHEEVGATEWAETTLHKMQQRFVQLGVRGIPTDEEMHAHVKRVKKMVINDLCDMKTPKALLAARTLHKTRHEQLTRLLLECTLSTNTFPPRILHLPTSSTDKYCEHEMLHVNEADKRRLMAGRVTIQEISRKSWWTPCFVVKNSRKTIPLPGVSAWHVRVSA